MITSNLFFLFIAGCCAFLVGINLAFVVELWRQLSVWFTVQLLGTMGLLSYTALSVLVGDPSTWRALIAFVAVALDLVAFVWMYTSVQALHRSGVVGFIPLARLREPADN